jgi:hypothetical protein
MKKKQEKDFYDAIQTKFFAYYGLKLRRIKDGYHEVMGTKVSGTRNVDFWGFKLGSGRVVAVEAKKIKYDSMNNFIFNDSKRSQLESTQIATLNDVASNNGIALVVFAMQDNTLLVWRWPIKPLAVCDYTIPPETSPKHMANLEKDFGYIDV